MKICFMEIIFDTSVTKIQQPQMILITTDRKSIDFDILDRLKNKSY